MKVNISTFFYKYKVIKLRILFSFVASVYVFRYTFIYNYYHWAVLDFNVRSTEKNMGLEKIYQLRNRKREIFIISLHILNFELFHWRI